MKEATKDKRLHYKSNNYSRRSEPHKLWLFVCNDMISVIVPYKDSENWIGRCFQSLHGQRGDFEFIFVNDHSTDRGKELLTVYVNGDDRFLLLDNQRAAGVSGARNTGLSVAHGEWVTFLDSDDEMLPDAWAKFSRAIETEADMHQFNHIRHYNVRPVYNVNRSRYDNPPGIYSIRNLPQVWFGVWNKLYKHELLDGIRFDEAMQYGEDLILNLECLAKSGEIHHADTATVRHNVENMESLSHIRSDADLIKELKALEDYIIRHKDRQLRELAYSLIEERIARSWYRRTICG